jgi:hypothetical protein
MAPERINALSRKFREGIRIIKARIRLGKALFFRKKNTKKRINVLMKMIMFVTNMHYYYLVQQDVKYH